MNTTKNETKRTPGALRAAEAVSRLVYSYSTPLCDAAEIAPNIDRETHAPALLAALELMLDASWNGPVGCDHPARKQASEAIAAARGEKEGA